MSEMTGNGRINSCGTAIGYFACELTSLSKILERDLDKSNESPCFTGGGIGIVFGGCGAANGGYHGSDFVLAATLG